MLSLSSFTEADTASVPDFTVENSYQTAAGPGGSLVLRFPHILPRGNTCANVLASPGADGLEKTMFAPDILPASQEETLYTLKEPSHKVLCAVHKRELCTYGSLCNHWRFLALNIQVFVAGPLWRIRAAQVHHSLQLSEVLRTRAIVRKRSGLHYLLT